jgi:hypothetical protein
VEGSKAGWDNDYPIKVLNLMRMKL